MALIDGPTVVEVKKNGKWSAAESYSDSRIVKYEWDMGDGSEPIKGKNITYKYRQAGTYTITLTVTDKEGDTATTTLTVVVFEKPKATIQGPKSVKLDETVTFDGSGSTGSHIVRYEWNMGDGSDPIEGPVVQYQWAHTGTYKVTLTVTDSFGNTATATLTVKVTNK